MRPETEDMQTWVRERFLPRYEAGHKVYKGENINAPPVRNLRNAIEEIADAAFYLRQIELVLNGEGLIPEFIYVAGPYSAETEERKQEHIAAAMDVGAELYRRGYAPFIPHSMTADFDVLYPDIPKEVYIKTDLLWISLCPSIFMLRSWEESPGAQIERNLAIITHKAIYYNLDHVPDLTEGKGI